MKIVRVLYASMQMAHRLPKVRQEAIVGQVLLNPNALALNSLSLLTSSEINGD